MNAPFGLEWHASRASLRNRFTGLAPALEAEHAIAYPLAPIAERIWAEGGHCPTMLLAGPERIGDEVMFDFANDCLQAVLVRFGYAFDAIGQDPDTLSEQAMSAHASAELHKLLIDFTTKYGAPTYFSEKQNRAGTIHAQGTALFGPIDGSMVQLIFGHDGGSSLLGEIRYRACTPKAAGF